MSEQGSINYVALVGAIEDGVKAYNRLRNWHDLAERYSVYRENGIAGAEDLMRGKRPPSESVKWQAYSAAGRIRQMLGDDRRATDLYGIAEAIDQGRRALDSRFEARAAAREAVAA